MTTLFFKKKSHGKYSLLDIKKKILEKLEQVIMLNTSVFCLENFHQILTGKKNDFKLFSMKKMVQICQILKGKNSKSLNFYDNFFVGNQENKRIFCFFYFHM